jgi:hypothetical protein
MRNILFISLLTFSCTWEKENILISNNSVSNCDTINIGYSKFIQPIFQAHCYSCHSTSVTSSGGGLDIENFSSLTNYLNRNYNGIFGFQFYQIVSQSPGTLPMPPGYKLPDCDIAKIKAWINKGAQNN